MPRLSWDNTGERRYKTGIDHVVLYPQAADGNYPLGVAWNGVSNITDSPSGGEANPIYADNMKYLNLMSAEEFGCSIEAYTYPDEFDQCNGMASVINGVIVGQQTRKAFGLSYRNIIGNDVLGDDYGYELHLVYNGKCTPSEESHDTVNDSPEATAMSWEVETTSVAPTSIDPNTGKPYKPTSTIKIDSTKIDRVHLKALEDLLYGTESASPQLPSPDAVISLMRRALQYTAASPVGTESPVAEGWYERSGSDPDYVYTLSTDTAVDNSKTYYVASLAS